jgi:hypothetical protein
MKSTVHNDNYLIFFFYVQISYGCITFTFGSIEFAKY